MAGDWIKMRTCLRDERAVMLICDRTGLDSFGVVGRLHAIWSWAGDHTANGTVRGVTLKTIDRIAVLEGFGSAMVDAEWLEELQDGGLRFPRWKMHNSKAAKERCLAAQRKARQRAREREPDRDTKRDFTVTSHAAREEKTTEDERKEKKITVRTAEVPSSGQSHSPKKAIHEENPFDLSGVSWPKVIAMADALGRRVRPRTDADRRAWLKFAVMADVTFGEGWLISAAEGVAHAVETRKSPQAHLVGILRASAAEKHHVAPATFDGIFRRIHLPIEVWNSSVLRAPLSDA